jgi:DNA-binding response OmpR family regulator
VYALLVAQNTDEGALLSFILQRCGLAVTSAHDLARALRTWPERPVDLILLAIREADPLSSVRRIRGETTVPLVMVVDPLAEDMHCALLEAGADLIIPRPFSALLLMSRVRTLLRRTGSVPLFSLPTLSIAGLTLDPATRAVQISGHPPRRLTHLEFRLLYTLMLHRGQVLPTETIVEQVWGYSGRGDKELVRGLVRRLRSKIEPEPHEPRYVLTVPGIGYSFASEPD